MNRHCFRFLLHLHVEHRERAHLRVHAVTSAVSWLALVTALSQIPIPFALPVLGASLGAAFVAVSLTWWLFVDVLATAAVALLTFGWIVLPGSPWGPGYGVPGVVGSVLVLATSETAARWAHVYYHEPGAFLRGAPRSERVLTGAHGFLWGPFYFWLHGLVRSGWRPRLGAALDAEERKMLAGRESVPWQSWSRLASCEARFACMPRTREEMIDAVRAAVARGSRVRVVGSGFSWSSLVPCDDTLLFCERLDRVEVDVSTPDAPVAWVEAGVTNRTLNAALARHGLCMPWNVVLENVRIAGIASTGTHGTGKRTATVGDLVEAFEVVDMTGRTRTLSEETVGVEAMRAVRLGLGLFGVITRLKLRVSPIHRVRQTDRRLPIATMLRDLSELVGAHDSVELYWFPFNRDMWMRTVDRTTEPRTRHGHGFWFKAQNLVQNLWLIAFSKLVMRFAPALTPTLLRLGLRMLPYRSRVLDLPASHHYHHWIELLPAGCMEVGFKVNEGFDNVRRAWQVTERLVDEYAARGLYPLNLSLNVRFIGASEALLTPAYGTGLTCYVEVMWMGRPEGWSAFTSELCRAWLEAPGALPHWSKELEHVEGIVPLVRAALGDRRGRFLAALSALQVDPHQRLVNPLVQRLLVDEA